MDSDFNIVVLPGDGIGIEVIDATLALLDPVQNRHGFRLKFDRQPGNANPTATFLSAGMMLERLGERHANDSLLKAVRAIQDAVSDLQSSQYLTGRYRRQRRNRCDHAGRDRSA